MAVVALVPLAVPGVLGAGWTGPSSATVADGSVGSGALDGLFEVHTLEGVGPAWAVEQQQRNLETAGAILDRVEQAREDGHASEDGMDLAEAVELAKLGTRHQVQTLGLEWTEPSSSYDHASPSQALFELAERHEAELTGEQVERVEALDELPADLRDALTRFVDAFLVLEDATHQAYEDVDLEALDGLEAELDAGDVAMAASSDDGAPWQGVLAEAGVDLAPVFPARSALLAATVDLERALATSPGVASTNGAAGPIVVAPAFAIDVDGTSSTYTEDVALSVDVGGDDTYHNNAGGSNLAGGSCSLTDPGRVGMAAALVDLGSGVDAYGDVAAPRGCGANGGGSVGVGFLVDAGGGDTYTGGGGGANGGGWLGVGFLADAGGSDTYAADNGGVNGGGWLGGVGFLVDAGGGDTYTGDDRGVNGGARLGGVGFLVDAGGGDTYTGGGGGANGGGWLGGVGFLVDAGGNDTYQASSSCCLADEGVNGGGDTGVGFLLDASGTDTYDDDQGGTGTDKTVVPKGIFGAQIDSDEASVNTCPSPAGNDVAVCLTPGTEIDSFGVAPATGPTHDVAGYVDRYAFPLPTGGEVDVACVNLTADGNTVNPCELAGGTFEAHVLTLVDTPVSEPGPAATVGVCEATLTLKVASFGLQDVPVVTVC